MKRVKFTKTLRYKRIAQFMPKKIDHVLIKREEKNLSYNRFGYANRSQSENDQKVKMWTNTGTLPESWKVFWNMKMTLKLGPLKQSPRTKKRVSVN